MGNRSSEVHSFENETPLPFINLEGQGSYDLAASQLAFLRCAMSAHDNKIYLATSAKSSDEEAILSGISLIGLTP